MNAIRVASVAVAVGFLAGCEQPAQPPQQHSELRPIQRDELKIVPRVTDGSPIRVDAMYVTVVGPNNSTLGARAEWQATGPPDEFQRYFLGEVAKTKPTGTPERVGKLVVRCRYFDAEGVATGSDDLDMKIPKEGTEYKGRLQFTTLGINGRVARIDVEVVKITFVVEGDEREVDVLK